MLLRQRTDRFVDFRILELQAELVSDIRIIDCEHNTSWIVQLEVLCKESAIGSRV